MLMIVAVACLVLVAAACGWFGFYAWRTENAAWPVALALVLASGATYVLAMFTGLAWSRSAGNASWAVSAVMLVIGVIAFACAFGSVELRRGARRAAALGMIGLPVAVALAAWSLSAPLRFEAAMNGLPVEGRVIADEDEDTMYDDVDAIDTTVLYGPNALRVIEPNEPMDCEGVGEALEEWTGRAPIREEQSRHSCTWYVCHGWSGSMMGTDESNTVVAVRFSPRMELFKSTGPRCGA